SQAGKVVVTIVLFFVVYLLLIILAGLLAAFCIYGGISIIIAVPKFLTLLLGAGLVGVGVMVFFFLIKFIFAVSKFDNADHIEIREEEQPELFAFIRQLSIDTQTAFPKKIFLSPDVNAAVFYNSSFWSMFLPVKKNLVIGMGLVNVLTVSELKAVVAHEFGHFSQKSMKLGSFVYNVNKVIFNMLYHNDSYGSTLGAWANIHWMFALFANITVKIVQGIQWVLGKMYGVVNVQNFGLSREMEFHADAVAAATSGSSSLVSALQRLELADSSYHGVLVRYSDWLEQKMVGQNLYNDQDTMMRHFAEKYNLEIKDGIVQVSDSFHSTTSKSRINYKDQWASHPATSDRTERLNRLNIQAEQNNASAWVLFRDKENLQKTFTEKIYTGVQLPEQVTSLDTEGFKSRFVKENADFMLPELFSLFFAERRFSEFDLSEIERNYAASAQNETFNSVINAETQTLPAVINGLKEDIRVLDQIISKDINVKTFDFDSEKMKSKDAPEVRQKLEKELKEAENKLTDTDKKLLGYFFTNAASISESAKQEFAVAFNDFRNAKEDSTYTQKLVNDSFELLSSFYSGSGITIEQVNTNITELKDVKEPSLKIQLDKWLSKEDPELAPVFKEKAKLFIEADYRYFMNDAFLDNELGDYSYLLRELWSVAALNEFSKFRKMLDLQNQWLAKDAA
ncbi:MAG: M48 family metallopeptidase, partial [Flavitalea sp.]